MPTRVSYTGPDGGLLGPGQSLLSLIGLAIVSASVLLFEISLVRLFAIAQGYHFAFLVISLALLGFGASGSVLARWPQLSRPDQSPRLALAALIFSATVLGSYLVVNYLPFDAYSIAWDVRQSLLLALNYFALTLPFLVGGLATGILLAARPAHANATYAANLGGSAAGCGLALGALPLFGGEGAVVSAALLGCVGALAFVLASSQRPRWTALAASAIGVLCFALLLGRPTFLEPQLSPYKGLAQALRYPEARVVLQNWNAYSRVDLVESEGVRGLPGLSYTYQGAMPRQWGISVDGEDVMPVILPDDDTDWRFLDFLPTAVVYTLRPNAEVLILDPVGGLNVWQAVHLGAREAKAVQPNDLILDAVARAGSPVYEQPGVSPASEDARVFLSRRPRDRYDVIDLALTDPFRSVAMGALSLSEEYDLTREAFVSYLRHLRPDGLLVATRWLQVPPSESVRLLALIVEALEEIGVDDPSAHIVGTRSIQTATFIVGRSPLSAQDLAEVRAFAEALRFDLTTAPDLRPDEINRYNLLPEPYYADAYAQVLAGTAERHALYRESPFAVDPPHDERPFYFHFFKWAQTAAVWEQLGRQWLPFGGSGYFVLLILLAFAILASVVLIIAPLIGRPHATAATPPAPGASSAPRLLAYFGCLGLGFLLVEIPIIQRSILFLEQPVYAFSAVVLGVMGFAGLGSYLSAYLPLRRMFPVLVAVIIVYPLILPAIFNTLLELPLAVRFVVTILMLAPMTLLGIPFPAGLMRAEQQRPGLVPWAWAVNGCGSVLSGVLAQIIALSWGFTVVLGTGAAFYTLAWVLAPRRLPGDDS